MKKPGRHIIGVNRNICQVFRNITTLPLAFASLESLGQDKTFKSLESLTRLFRKVSKNIIGFFILFNTLSYKTHENIWFNFI